MVHDRFERHAMGIREQLLHQPRLDEREVGATGADAQEGRRLQSGRVPCSQCGTP